jgi:hypothetical protein
MSQRNLDEALQWAGAVLIVLGHTFNAIGPAVYPWNIVVFALGTVAFLAWAYRVGNRPQLAVNAVSIAIGLVGLYNALAG